MRSTLARPTYLLVRVAPTGFVLEHEDREELLGRIVKSHLVRKRFEDGMLACNSHDSITARDGTLCHDCRHPRCLTFLRIHLHDGPVVYVLDLAPTAARALLDLEDLIESEQERLVDVPVRLTVIDRGHWGLVHIERA
jgi:hypothetical protein